MPDQVVPHALLAPRHVWLLVDQGRDYPTGEYAMARAKKPKKSAENTETAKIRKGRKKTTAGAGKAARNKK
jgi:hypothetical protein